METKVKLNAKQMLVLQRFNEWKSAEKRAEKAEALYVDAFSRLDKNDIAEIIKETEVTNE